MPDFEYTAINPQTGGECRDRLTSATKTEALRELRERAVVLTSLSPVEVVRLPAGRSVQPARESVVASHGGRGRRGWALARRTTNRKGLTAFTRQLAILVSAGLPVHRALETLARAEPNPRFRHVIRELAQTIANGGTLSDGLEAEPGTFDRLYRHMTKAGEVGGALGAVLGRLAQFLERSDRLRGRLKAAMAYPLIILFLAGVVLAALMIVVVPKFELIFHGLLKGQPLPALTRALLATSSFLGHHVLSGLSLVVLGGFGLRKLLRLEWGIRLRDRAILKLPIVGELSQKAAMARLTRTVSSLLASGVPILDTLRISKESSGNSVIADAIDAVHLRVKEGSRISQALVEARIFPHIVTRMVEVGEETGALPEMLTRIANVYEEEVDLALVAFASLIEPALIVVMALLVGVIVVALFLPIVGIMEHLQ